MKPRECSGQTLGERTSKLGPFQSRKGAQLRFIHIRKSVFARHSDPHRDVLNSGFGRGRRRVLVRVVGLAGKVSWGCSKLTRDAVKVLRPVCLAFDQAVYCCLADADAARQLRLRE